MIDENPEDWNSIYQQLSHLSHEDEEMQSVLIDFGGISCYQCNLKNKYVPSIQGRFFIAWKNVASQRAKQNCKDIERIVQYDFLSTKIMFFQWKNKFEDRRFQRQKDAFRTWKILSSAKIKERDQSIQKAIEMVIYWRNLSMQHLFFKHRAKRVRKRFFQKWLAQFLNHKKTLTLNQRVNKLRLKRYMRLWKFRFRVHKNRSNEIKIREQWQQRTEYTFFDQWRFLYIQKVRQVPRRKHLLRSFFHQWKTAQETSIVLQGKFNQIAQRRDRTLELKAISKWKNRFRTKKRKIQRKRINLWARIVIREITFSRAQLLHAQILMGAAFRQMKIKYQKKNLSTKMEFFRIWMLFVKREKQKRECQQLRVTFALSRCFGRWRLLYTNLEEAKEVAFVKARVVDSHIKQRVFCYWLDRAIENFKRRQVIAIRFKKNHLKQKIFKAWHQHARMQQIRAVEYYKSITLSKYFSAFVRETIIAARQNEERAQNFHFRVLKKRYFNRLKTCVKCEPDEKVSELIALLNNRCTYKVLRPKFS